jgi:hypothetical protein
MIENLFKSVLIGSCFAFILILFSNSALADRYCMDNQTLRNNNTINGNTIIIDNTCLYGCDTKLNICIPSVTIQIFVIFSIGIGILVIIYIIKKVL